MQSNYYTNCNNNLSITNKSNLVLQTFFQNEYIENIQEKKQDLRDKIYNKMVERSKASTYEFIKYERKEEK